MVRTSCSLPGGVAFKSCVVGGGGFECGRHQPIRRDPIAVSRSPLQLMNCDRHATPGTKAAATCQSIAKSRAVPFTKKSAPAQRRAAYISKKPHNWAASSKNNIALTTRHGSDRAVRPWHGRLLRPE